MGNIPVDYLLLFVAVLFLGLGLFLSQFFSGLFLFPLAFFHFVFGIVHTHAGHFVLDGHDWMSKEHSCTGGAHDFHKFLGLLFTEALNLAAIADWLGNAVWALVHFGHNGGQQGGTFRTKLAAAGAMVLMAIYAEGFLNSFLLLGNIIFYLKWFFLR